MQRNGVGHPGRVLRLRLVSVLSELGKQATPDKSRVFITDVSPVNIVVDGRKGFVRRLAIMAIIGARTRYAVEVWST